jgi:hypothetical protein
MPVSEVMGESGSKVIGQSNIVKFPSRIKGIHSVPPSNIVTDDVLVFSQSLP